MKVRSAGSADTPRIRELAVRLMDQSLPHWRDPAPLKDKLNEALAAYDGEMPQDHLLLVCEDDKGWIAGFAHAGMDADFFSGEAQAHLYYLVTDPSCEGKGVGRMLMDAVEDFARDKSATGILLYVFSTNERARSVYERYGFQEHMLKMVKPVSATRASGHSSK